MKRYFGRRIRGRARVYWKSKAGCGLLLPVLEMGEHSAGHFEWGYLGKRPARLALSLLFDLAGESRALLEYQSFKREVVAALPHYAWELSQEEILCWLWSRAVEFSCS